MKKLVTLLAVAATTLAFTTEAEAGNRGRKSHSHKKKSSASCHRGHSYGYSRAPIHRVAPRWCPPVYGSSYRGSCDYGRPYYPSSRSACRPSYSFSIRLGGW